MTTTKDTDKDKEENSQPPLLEQTVDDPVPAPAPARSPLALTIGLVALGLAIGLSAVAYFTWYQVQQLADRQAGIQDSVSERVQPLRAALDETRTELQAGQDAATRRLEGLAADQQSVGNRLNVLAAMMGRSERGWTLAEVEYLLRIANQRLQLQRDALTAIQALQSADERLRDLADPRYMPVRKQIALDIDAIRAVPVVDVEGLVAQLSAMLDRVNKLPVAGSRYQPPADSEAESAPAENTAHSAEELPALVWHSLSDLFRVRQHDQAVGPMLPPEDEYFLRENLRLQLGAARLALLRGDRAQYKAALRTAADWLNTYFDVEDAEVQQLIGRMETLADSDILPPVPDVSASLSLLRQQMKLSEKPAVLPVVPEAGPAGEPASEEEPDA